MNDRQIKSVGAWIKIYESRGEHAKEQLQRKRHRRLVQEAALEPAVVPVTPVEPEPATMMVQKEASPFAPVQTIKPQLALCCGPVHVEIRCNGGIEMPGWLQQRMTDMIQGILDEPDC